MKNSAGGIVKVVGIPGGGVGKLKIEEKPWIFRGGVNAKK